MNLKKYLIPIIVMLVGLAITIVGALFKIQHWPYGSELLTIGMLLESFGVILLIIKLILENKRSN